MYNPPHPGQIIRNRCLKTLDLTVTEAAKSLAVSRSTLSELLHERAGVSPDMALKLAHVFGGTPETWLKLQMQFDLFKAEKKFRPEKLKRYDTQTT